MRFNLGERKGIFKAGLFFTEILEWVFREQPLVDVGVDALVEESIDGNPTGKFLAAQIKSGLGNFNKTKKSDLVYYLTATHYHYWTNLDFPIVMIGYIPDEDELYWQKIDNSTVEKTNKGWKLTLPNSKKMSLNSKKELQQIIKSNNARSFKNDVLNNNVSIEELEKAFEDSQRLLQVSETLNELGDILSQMNTAIVEDTERLIRYTKSKKRDTSPEVKRIIAKTSSDMNTFAKRLLEKIEIFSLEFVTSFSGGEKLAIIELYLNKNHLHLEKLHSALRSLEETLVEATKSVFKMKNEILTLPKKYKNLNNSSIKMIGACDVIIEEYKAAQQMTNGFKQWIYQEIY